jgi:nitroimidazol reductase NimA-like FMN-containing flavoprotein (pyridoxamine 5'-phosphate oxidase superfamily)
MLTAASSTLRLDRPDGRSKDQRPWRGRCPGLHDHGMMQTGFEAVELSRAECLSFLAAAPFGRLVFTHAALPAVMAVNFVLLPEGIVIRTREGSVIAAAVSGKGAVVAFEADDIDPVRRSGWTVTVVGAARVVSAATERAAVTRRPLESWVPGEKNVLILVELGLVSGRRIGGAEPVRLDERRPQPRLSDAVTVAPPTARATGVEEVHEQRVERALITGTTWRRRGEQHAVE